MRIVLVGSLLVTLAVAAGCGGSPKPAPATPPMLAAPPAAPSAAAPPARRLAPQEALTEHVPQQAVAVLIVRRGALALPLGLLDADPAMQRELGAYLTRELGVDLTKIEGAVAYSTNLAARSGAVFLRMREVGPLRGRTSGSYQGVALIELAPMIVAAAVPGGVVVGMPTEVATAIDLAHRRIAPVGSGAPLAFALRQRPEEADLLAAVAVAGLGDPAVAAVVQQFGVTGATLTFQRDNILTLRVEGDGSKLGAIREIIRAGGAMMIEQIAQQKARAQQRHDVAEAVGAIIAHSMARRTLREIEPRLEGNTLVSSYQAPRLESGAALIPFMGVLAAVAVPNFLKYIRRAKAAEARTNLGRLGAAVRQYAADHRQAGKRFAFPATTPWSPAVACCKQPSAPKCRPGLGAFSHPTWKALRFDLTDPFFYQYRLTSEGKGKKARVVLEARGDLDCNGTSSSFRLAGHLDDKGELVVGELEVKHETE